MSQSLQEQRWAENEVIFRNRNKAVIDEMAEIKTIARSDKQEHLVEDNDDDELLFFCECANEKCHERIRLTVHDYKKYHRSSSEFIVLPGHHVPEIERILFDGGAYYVVEKYMTPPKHADKLNPTPL
jgi:hypothetical protein